MVGIRLALLLGALGACSGTARPEPEPILHSLPSPSAEERYCAWYGDARGGVLYFGAAAFWSAYRSAGGDPTADLRAPGPQLVGRFDLARRRFLPSLDVTEPGARTGVWDVLAAADGSVYFTTFYGSAGVVEPGTGAVRHFSAAGVGLNELTEGPEGTLFATRYGDGAGGPGSVVQLDAEGRVLAEYTLTGPSGFRVAPKSVAWDPVRGDLWVTTDLLPESGADFGHDTRILDATGRQRLRITRPEVQFVSFAADGTRYAAVVRGPGLDLEIWPPGRGVPRRVRLDDAFDRELDFVQDIKLAGPDRAVVTRWGGRVHLVGRSGPAKTWSLPRPAADALYYTAVLADGRLCATLCDGLSVVCLDLGE